MIAVLGDKMLKKAKIVNCHELSIRKDPTNTIDSECVSSTIKSSEEIVVDTSEIIYSWDDKEFYKVVSSGEVIGYARIDCLEIKE